MGGIQLADVMQSSTGDRNAGSAADLDFADIGVGDRVSFRHAIVTEDVDLFARLSGDFNPLHVDATYAKQTEFGRRVVHGMFLAALFSRLVGMHLPGRRCLYLSQTLDFSQPVFIGDEVEVSGRVIGKQDATRTLVLRTELRVLPDRLAVHGKAYVRVLP
jgi:acyl dehydratase